MSKKKVFFTLQNDSSSMNNFCSEYIGTLMPKNSTHFVSEENEAIIISMII